MSKRKYVYGPLMTRCDIEYISPDVSGLEAATEELIRIAKRAFREIGKKYEQCDLRGHIVICIGDTATGPLSRVELFRLHPSMDGFGYCHPYEKPKCIEFYFPVGDTIQAVHTEIMFSNVNKIYDNTLIDFAWDLEELIIRKALGTLPETGNCKNPHPITKETMRLTARNVFLAHEPLLFYTDEEVVCYARGYGLKSSSLPSEFWNVLSELREAGHRL